MEDGKVLIMPFQTTTKTKSASKISDVKKWKPKKEKCWKKYNHIKKNKGKTNYSKWKSTETNNNKTNYSKRTVINFNKQTVI